MKIIYWAVQLLYFLHMIMEQSVSFHKQLVVKLGSAYLIDNLGVLIRSNFLFIFDTLSTFILKIKYNVKDEQKCINKSKRIYSANYGLNKKAAGPGRPQAEDVRSIPSDQLDI